MVVSQYRDALNIEEPPTFNQGDRRLLSPVESDHAGPAPPTRAAPHRIDLGIVNPSPAPRGGCRAQRGGWRMSATGKDPHPSRAVARGDLSAIAERKITYSAARLRERGSRLADGVAILLEARAQLSHRI